jgi:hypothetical protein
VTSFAIEKGHSTVGADVIIQIVALPEDNPPDLDAAKDTATRLAHAATLDEVAAFAGSHWPDDPPVDPHTFDEHTFQAYAPRLRDWVETQPHHLLDEFAGSLHSRDVTGTPLPGYDNSTAVYLYLTGGPSWGDPPTDAYQICERLLDQTRQPHGWPDQLAAALGLLRTDGHGDPAATTVWRRWT